MIRRLKHITTIFLGTWISFSVIAEQLADSHFADQWDQAVIVDASTQLVIFSADMDASKLVRAVLEDYSKEDLSANHWVYIADISAMPSLISSMFAIPKMKKYPFSVGLDRKGEPTQAWPRQAGQVTVMQLQQRAIKQTLFFAEEESLKDYLIKLTQTP